MSTAGGSLAEAAKEAGDWKFCDAEFRGIEREVGPFTLDGCANADNALKWRFCLRDDSVLARDLAGESVWFNPPFDEAFVDALLDHYEEGKTRAPVTTSAALVLPLWECARWWPRLRHWTRLRYYPRGSNLFTAPAAKGGKGGGNWGAPDGQWWSFGTHLHPPQTLTQVLA